MIHSGKQPLTSIIILRLPAVLKRRGRSRSAHYVDINDGLFIRPVRIGSRATGTPEYEVELLNQARVAGRADHEIRELVRALEAARKEMMPGGIPQAIQDRYLPKSRQQNR